MATGLKKYISVPMVLLALIFSLMTLAAVMTEASNKVYNGSSKTVFLSGNASVAHIYNGQTGYAETLMINAGSYDIWNRWNYAFTASSGSYVGTWSITNDCYNGGGSAGTANVYCTRY